jgi:hypothetical protein
MRLLDHSQSSYQLNAGSGSIILLKRESEIRERERANLDKSFFSMRSRMVDGEESGWLEGRVF